jgi:hypothetical protein
VLINQCFTARLENIPKLLPPASSFNKYTYHSYGKRLASDAGCASIKVTLKIYCCFYGFETWSLTLRELYWLKVLENMVLRKPFGSKREDESGGCRKIYDVDLH